MTLVERYIFRTVLSAFLAGLGALTGVIWITQALREFDLLTTKGQALLVFLTVTGLTIPSLVMIIAPVAFLIAILYSLNKLNSDSELIVMSAAGLSPARLIRPYAVLTFLVFLLVGAMSLYVMPWSFRELRDILSHIRADFLTKVVKEGRFVTLDQGFVFHYRERGPNGELLGIFMQDRRDPEKISTYIAEAGLTLESNGQNYLVLEKGIIQRESKTSRDPALVSFQRYAIDLAQFGQEGEDSPLKPRERTTTALLYPDGKDQYYARLKSRFRAELHDRFVNPLYVIAFAMIGFAALGQPRTTRQGRGAAIGTAIVLVLAVRVAGFGTSALLTRNASFVWLVYALPLFVILWGWLSIFMPDVPRMIWQYIMQFVGRYKFALKTRIS